MVSGAAVRFKPPAALWPAVTNPVVVKVAAARAKAAANLAAVKAEARVAAVAKVAAAKVAVVGEADNRRDCETSATVLNLPEKLAPVAQPDRATAF